MSEQEARDAGQDETAAALQKMRAYAEKYRDSVGLKFSSVPEVTEAVLLGLAKNMLEVKRPLCPCNFYQDKAQEAARRRWLCPCDEMQIFKYCHCLLYVADNDMPVTEHLPEGHEGRQMYGDNPDPAPDKGRGMRSRSAEDIMSWYEGK